MAVFELANIQYGRIDYALHDGRIEVFEINTNPWSLSADRLIPALADLPDAGHGRISVSIPAHTRKPTPGALLEQRRLRIRAVLKRLGLLGLRKKLRILGRRDFAE